MSEAQSIFIGPPRAVIPDLPAMASLACEHCGNVSKNLGEARYHATRLCGVLHPLAAPMISGLVDSSPAGDFESNPEWKRFGFRGEVAEVLMSAAREWNQRAEGSGDEKMRRKALRLKRKAIRFANCGRLGRSAVCSLYPLEHKFYVSHDCGTDFCVKCAQGQRWMLFDKYLRVILNAVAGGIPKGCTLARVTFTLRSDGSEITPQRVKAFNSAVRFTMRKTVGSRKGYGFLFSDEVGFETRGHLPDAQRKAHGLNLHCHGLYLGPRLPNDSKCTCCGSVVKRRKRVRLWDCPKCGVVSEVESGLLTQIFIAETKKRFGVESRHVYLSKVKGFGGKDSERVIRHALSHLLKYLSKPPAVTSGRLSALIIAFDGAKRVHALGKFYGKCPKKEAANCPCPTCKRMCLERPGVLSFDAKVLADGGSIPRLALVRDLIEQGYLPLKGDGRTIDFGDALAVGGAGP